MSKQIIMYATDWCPDCVRAKRFLDDRKLPYQYINIDHDEQGERFVLQANQGARVVPTIVFPDGSILAEPSDEQLALKLDLTP